MKTETGELYRQKNKLKIEKCCNKVFLLKSQILSFILMLYFLVEAQQVKQYKFPNFVPCHFEMGQMDAFSVQIVNRDIVSVSLKNGVSNGR